MWAHFNKNYFIASILVHLLVMLGIGFMIRRDALENKNFVIFGAHSRYTTKALYKSSKPVPFVGSGTTKRKKKSKSNASKKTNIKNTKKSRTSKKVAAKSAKKTIASKKAKANAAKTKKGAILKPGLVPKGPSLTMPSPTAMIEDSIKVAKPKDKKKIKKKTLRKIKLAAMPKIEEEVLEQEVAQQEEPITPPKQEKIEEKKIEEKKIEESAATLPAPAQSAEDQIRLSLESDEEIPEEMDDDEDTPIHVGVVDSSDPVTRYHQRILSAEISRLWTPPPGVRKGTECSAAITLDKTGKVKTFNFVKRSNIPIYDLSVVRLKLAQFELPTDFRTNKPLLVVFHQ